MFNRMYKACASSTQYVSEGWSNWNKKVDDLANQTLDYTAKLLPHNLQKTLSEEYRTQAKIVILWLSGVALSQATFGNPFIVWKISYPIGVIGNLATVNQLSVHMKQHLKDCNKLSRTEATISTTLPVLLTGGIVVDCAVLGTGRSIEGNITQALWGECAIGCGTMVLTSYFILKIREAEQEKKSLESESKTELLKQKNTQEKISKYDNFVKAHPTLKKEFIEAYEANKNQIAELPSPNTQHLNPNDPKDALTLLKIKNSNLDHLLNERILFVKNNETLLYLFKSTFEDELKNSLVFHLPMNELSLINVDEEDKKMN